MSCAIYANDHWLTSKCTFHNDTEHLFSSISHSEIPSVITVTSINLTRSLDLLLLILKIDNTLIIIRNYSLAMIGQSVFETFISSQLRSCSVFGVYNSTLFLSINFN